MPYFIYRINQGPTSIVKHLELLKEFEVYREAKDFTKSTRAELDPADNAEIKMIFAENQLHAEEQLQEKREKPITREWEK